MYDGLETNIPHTLMKHSDDPSLQEHQLFPTREAVLDYLQRYAAKVEHLVQFSTQVVDVRLRSHKGRDEWSVQTHNLLTKKFREMEYDAVCVASGHYSVPMLPDIKNIRQWDQANPGVITHSKFYRNAESYQDKKTIIVGNSASGTDIASHISAVAEYPIIVSQRSDSPLMFSAAYKKTVPEIAEFISPSSMNRAVRFKDGHIETDIDAILFCTGYYYSFPFLSSLTPPLVGTGDRVQNLYQHLFYRHHPSLAFIGVPANIIPFPTFEGQASVVSRVWSDRLNLPSVDEMEEWERNLLVERGAGKSFHVLRFPKDFDYHNEMVGWASKSKNELHGKIARSWSEQEYWERGAIPAIKRAFAEKGEGRRLINTLDGVGFGYDRWIEEQQAALN